MCPDFLVGKNMHQDTRTKEQFCANKCHAHPFMIIHAIGFSQGAGPGENWRARDLDGRNRAIVITESLARVIDTIRIASVCWRSYISPKTQN